MPEIKYREIPIEKESNKNSYNLSDIVKFRWKHNNYIEYSGN